MACVVDRVADREMCPMQIGRRTATNTPSSIADAPDPTQPTNTS
jgi:hypothetical protein